MKTLKLYFFIGIVFTAKFALAEGAEHGHHIPWNELIIPQAVNLTILAAGLAFALKGMVRGYFSGKATQFEAARKDAEAAKKQAEQTHAEVKVRLQQLETTAKSSLENAKREAQELKSKIIDEAKQIAGRLEEEAKRTASYELQKAAFALKSELLNKSMELADKDIKTQLDNKTHSDLQVAFVTRAQGVSR